jgi:hypothetical protein
MVDSDSDFEPEIEPTQEARDTDSGESATKDEEYPEFYNDLYDKGTKIHVAPRMKRLYFRTWDEFDEEFEAYCEETAQLFR